MPQFRMRLPTAVRVAGCDWVLWLRGDYELALATFVMCHYQIRMEFPGEYLEIPDVPL